MEPHFKSGLFKLRDRLFHLCLQRPIKSPIILHWICFNSDDHDFSNDTVTLRSVSLEVAKEDQSEHESVCYMWCTRCQQRSMRCCMTERTLSARLPPSLMRLRHFDLCWVSSSKFKDQWSNLRKISGQVRIIWVGFQLFKLFLVTVKAVSRDVRECRFMARALTVECIELTAASDSR